MGRPPCGPSRADPPSPPDRTARGCGPRHGRAPRGGGTRVGATRGGGAAEIKGHSPRRPRSPSQLDAPRKDRSRRPGLPPFPRLRCRRVSPSLAPRLASLPASAPDLASCSPAPICGDPSASVVLYIDLLVCSSRRSVPFRLCSLRLSVRWSPLLGFVVQIGSSCVC